MLQVGKGENLFAWRKYFVILDRVTFLEFEIVNKSSNESILSELEITLSKQNKGIIE